MVFLFFTLGIHQRLSVIFDGKIDGIIIFSSVSHSILPSGFSLW
ncbi:hypothetical protein NT01EI_3152 [Edwardsiella ictaluri 93-146]|uniref:Uncharacterized protein n=1 Tax=Edwardsiella ictaluri (strain 93-146) TaxID=634503 RepID=C5BER4_EDWI9|nr:hypothetical protein NT01EI_3152 [Edwardsiella ictaluri 93-146]